MTSYSLEIAKKELRLFPEGFYLPTEERWIFPNPKQPNYVSGVVSMVVFQEKRFLGEFTLPFDKLPSRKYLITARNLFPNHYELVEKAQGIIHGAVINLSLEKQKFQDHLQSLQNLTPKAFLQIYNNYTVLENSYPDLLTILFYFTNLESITLDKSNLYLLEKFSYFRARSKKLKNFYIKDCFHLTNSDFIHLSQQSLNFLSLNRAHNLNDGLFRFLGKMEDLQCLGINGATLQGTGFHHLTRLPSFCKLWLHRIPITDQLMDGLEVLREKLRFLILTGLDEKTSETTLLRLTSYNNLIGLQIGKDVNEDTQKELKENLTKTDIRYT